MKAKIVKLPKWFADIATAKRVKHKENKLAKAARKSAKKAEKSAKKAAKSAKKATKTTPVLVAEL